jgi:hypothetical protein
MLAKSVETSLDAADTSVRATTLPEDGNNDPSRPIV